MCEAFSTTDTAPVSLVIVGQKKGCHGSTWLASVATLLVTYRPMHKWLWFRPVRASCWMCHGMETEKMPINTNPSTRTTDGTKVLL